MTDLTKPQKQISIWWFAFGYFAVYIPYSFFTKVLTGGLLAKDAPDQLAALKVNSFELLPPTIMASICIMLIFISSMRWWKFATQWHLGSLSLPRPRLVTLVSGFCTGFVVVTTTLAYTIDGVSIVFAMLLMRGGMLIMSPFVDKIFKRKVAWFSWAALGMSILALLISNFGPYVFGMKESSNQSLMNVALGIDLTVYLLAYFFRLSFMSKYAKNNNENDKKRFFVEEQMVGTPSILLILFIASFFAPGVIDNPSGFDNLLNGVHAGFYDFWSRPGNVIGFAMLIGFFSQFNGVFGGLILLDKSGNAFAVPVNRCSSILAGICASLALSIVFSTDLSGKPLMPGPFEFVGALFVIGAILFLTLPKLIASQKAKKAAEAAAAAAVADDAPKAETEATEATDDKAKS